MDLKNFSLKGLDFSRSKENLSASMHSLKTFNWKSLAKYFNPQASEDLNAFLEKLPQHTSHTLLVTAGIAWAAAGALGLYTAVQIQNLTELYAELQEANALQPVVPVVRDIAINPKEVKEFVSKMAGTYKNLEIKDQASSIVITAQSTAQFAQFREAVGHVQNGGSGWRVTTEKLCVGRECKSRGLAAALKINKVSVEKPG